MKRLACAFLLLAACGGDDDDAAPIDFEVCPQQHVEGGLLVCDQAFADGAAVRLPADTATTMYVAWNPTGNEGELITREGVGYRLVDEQGLITSDHEHRVPAGLGWGSYRFLYRVYEVSGTTGTLDGEATLEVTSARPVVEIASKVLDQRLLGAWEGTVTRCPGEPGLDQCTPDAPVPVRIELADLGEQRPLLVWDDMAVHLDGHELYTPTGKVANQSESVSFSDGSCPATIASLGSAAPWTGDGMKIYRYPAMHAPGDYQLVAEYPEGGFNNGMGSILPAHPASLIQTAPRLALDSVAFGVHGAPNGFQIQLHRVSGGGQPCTP